MSLTFKKLLLGSVAALFTVGIATAQMWLPFPIVGGSSFCSSTVNNSCVNTVPAGPTVTGNETIPADTNLSGGRSPQTVKIPVAVAGLGGIQNVVPLTGAEIFLSPGVGRLFLNPAGTIAYAGVNLPQSTKLYDGQILIIASSQTVTTFAMAAGTGTTVAEATTTLTTQAPVMYVYSAASATWFKIAP